MPSGVYKRTKPFSEEHKRNLSLANKGKKLSEEHKQKVRLAHTGTTVSEETKKKMSLAHKGIKFSAEWSKRISEAQRGTKNHQWKGGRKVTSNGYIRILQPSHPFSDKRGYVLEHRLVIEKQLGRYLELKEIVHHINNILSDNRIENLKLFPSNTIHLQFHNKIIG